MNQALVEKTIQDHFHPEFLKVHDWSHAHGSDHAETLKPLQKCFDLVIVSKKFEGKSLIARHRMVYGCMGMNQSTDIHSLTIQAHTPEEWKLRPSQGIYTA